MDQESCASINIGFEQTHALFGRIPRLNHDVVQFVAEEVIDYAFILVIDFQKVGQHSRRSESTFKSACL